jgi:DNA-binding NtrC family response regulator
LGPLNLLIVDDEPQIMELLVEEFQDLGVVCQTAENGMEALKLLRTNPPHAVLSDISMPVMDGLDLLLQMRELQIEIPIIFLTGHGEKDEAVRALRYGAFDFLSKPYVRNVLIETVMNGLQLGVELRTLDAELDELCAKKNFVGKELETFRRLKRFSLKNRKHLGVLKKTG